MKLYMTILLAIATATATIGCAADVETTKDSTKIEIEAPKVEVGDAPVDLDPRTDDDVDLDTRAPGDT